VLAKKPDGRCGYLKPGDCADGIAEYKRSYVDPFVASSSSRMNSMQAVIRLRLGKDNRVTRTNSEQMSGSGEDCKYQPLYLP